MSENTTESIDYTSAMEQITALIKAAVPYIWVTTHEEKRFIASLESEVSQKLNRALFTWSSCQGILPYDAEGKDLKATGDAEKTPDPRMALAYIHGYTTPTKDGPVGTIWILKDFHTVLQQPIPRQMRDLYGDFQTKRKTIIIVAPCLAHGPGGTKPGLEPTLEKQVIVVPYDLPSKNLIEKRVKLRIRGLKKKEATEPMGIKVNYTEQEIDHFVTALQGLTELEVDNALFTSACHLKRIDEQKLLHEKKQIIQRSEVLEYIGITPTMDEIGGLDNLKKYFKIYSNQFSKEAVAYGVDPLRGVLLVGICGCGKSLAAKAVASSWSLPLIRLDVGKVMQGLVGASEMNMRSAISQLEACAPAVCWLDEIEKGLSGTKSSNFSVSGYEKIWWKENGQLTYGTLRGLHRAAEADSSGFEVLALNPNTFKLEWKKLIRSIEHSTDKELLRVKTSSGREIVATQDHSFVTLDEDGNLVEIKTQDLLGKLIPFAKNISIEAKKSEVDLTPLNSVKTHHKIGKVKLDRDFGRFIGLFLAEGSVSGDSVAIACTEPAIIEFVLKMVHRLFPEKDIHWSPNSVSISSRPLSDWFRENFVLGADQKEIPSFLLETPREFRLGIVEGAISGDGSANFTNSNSLDLTISSTSTDLLYGYGMLLNSLGCRYTIKMPVKYPSAVERSLPCGLINICNLDHPLFEPISEHKKENLKNYRVGSVQTHRPTDRIPLPKNVIRNLGLSKTNAQQEVLRTKAYRGQLSATKVEECLSEVPHSSAKDKMLALIRGDVRWDIVESLETVEPEETVYDLEVEDSHTFVLASGTVVHNSDGGTLARVFGTLLTAMEERMKGIIVIATSNDIQALPPELIRRFNEVMFVDLPYDTEREEIFNIHLHKRGRDVTKLGLDMNELVAATKSFTGSEIEKAVKEGIARAFQAGQKDIEMKDLLSAIKDTRCIAKVMKEQIDSIRDWAKGKARYASSIAEKESGTSRQRVTTKGGKEIDVGKDLESIDDILDKESANRFDNIGK